MKPILQVLRKEKTLVPPIWIMRQAGRYLPEYRKIRAQAGGFLDLVYQPELAAEVTMQPVRRYAMDGAILFSDILIVPHALGQKLRFEEGRGPVLERVKNEKDICSLKDDPESEKFYMVGKTVEKISARLKSEKFSHTALIGFAGAPWTVACYMVEGSGSKEFHRAKKWAAQSPDSFGRLIDIISRATISYLKIQIKSGAEIIQIFDSWAGLADENMFQHFVIGPTKRIISALKAEFPAVPVIGFPRGAGIQYDVYARNTGIDGLGLDSAVPLHQARALQKICPVQGNLDPVYLLGEGDMVCERAAGIVQGLSNGGHIFNLGHGISKETDPDVVQRLVSCIRGQRPEAAGERL